MKNLCFICGCTLLSCLANGQSSLWMSRINDDACEARVKIDDERPTNCDFGGNFILYPVYEENFDFKQELPNNWSFRMGATQDDDPEVKGRGHCWIGAGNFGMESLERNIDVANGKATIKILLDNDPMPVAACPTCTPKDYLFTTSMLNSIFMARQGITTANIQLPENPNLWPAFWMMGANQQEIDIFEFYDMDISGSPCDTYHQMKVTLHGQVGNTHCKRGRKFPVSGGSTGFFSSPHDFKCIYSDYKIEVFLDNVLKSLATRYYEGPYYPSPLCQNHADSDIPSSVMNCVAMQSAPGCNLAVGNVCLDFNHVDEDESFPVPSSTPMNVRIGNSVNFLANNGSLGAGLFNSWNNFLDKDKEVVIDQFVLYQPINCNATFSIQTEADFFNSSGNSSFLGGNSISIGNATGSNTFNPLSNPWLGKQPTFHFLASDFIEFLPGFEIDEWTHVRATVINCTGPLANQRSTSGQNPESPTEASLELPSMVDSWAIGLYPNPTADVVNVSMEEEDYNDLFRMELVDNLGRSYPLERGRAIDLHAFPTGFYYVKFHFSNGKVAIKTIVKSSL